MPAPAHCPTVAIYAATSPLGWPAWSPTQLNHLREPSPPHPDNPEAWRQRRLVLWPAPDGRPPRARRLWTSRPPADHQNPSAQHFFARASQPEGRPPRARRCGTRRSKRPYPCPAPGVCPRHPPHEYSCGKSPRAELAASQKARPAHRAVASARRSEPHTDRCPLQKVLRVRRRPHLVQAPTVCAALLANPWWARCIYHAVIPVPTTQTDSAARG